VPITQFDRSLKEKFRGYCEKLGEVLGPVGIEQGVLAAIHCIAERLVRGRERRVSDRVAARVAVFEEVSHLVYDHVVAIVPRLALFDVAP
jgi:hypothetical protein